MDFLKSMVAEKKRKVFGVEGGAEGEAAPKKKFQRRGAAKAEEEAARNKESAELEKQRAKRRGEKDAEKEANAASAMGRKPITVRVPGTFGLTVEKTPEDPQLLSPKSPSTIQIPRGEAMRMLRVLREPIQLYGESDSERSERLRKLQRDHGVHDDEMNQGQRNDRVRDMENRGDETKGVAKNMNAKALTDGDPESPTSPGRVTLVTVEGMVVRWVKDALKEWEQTLEQRPDVEKNGVHGKNATATAKQCRRYMKPLFEMLENQTCSANILSKLAAMIGLIDKRRYQKANDLYLKLCIGNAPWPVGATSVGIHERAGRSRIFEGNIAHVMQDENTRKYLQSFKRIMTFLQSIRPHEDVSYNMG